MDKTDCYLSILARSGCRFCIPWPAQCICHLRLPKSLRRIYRKRVASGQQPKRLVGRNAVSGSDTSSRTKGRPIALAKPARCSATKQQLLLQRPGYQREPLHSQAASLELYQGVGRGNPLPMAELVETAELAETGAAVC